MITVESELVVKVEHKGQEAALTFKYPRVNKLKRYYTETDLFERAAVVFSQLVKVEGIQDSKGNPFTLEEAKELDIDIKLMVSILGAWEAAAVKEIRGEAEEKNASEVIA